MTTARRFAAVFTGRHSRSGVNEGLNVLFADLVKSLVALGVPVAIFTTERHLPGLQAVLRANGVDPGAIEIHALVRGSRVLDRAWSGLPAEKPLGLRARIGLRLARAFRAERFAALWAWLLEKSTLAWPLKVLCVVLAGVIGALFLVAGGALVAVCAVLYVGYALVRKAARLGSRAVSKFLRRRNGEPMVITLHQILLWRDRFTVLMHEHLYALESTQLARALNARRDIEACFFFNAFEGYVVEALAPAKKKLVVFPDVVPAMFPTRYPLDEFGRTHFRLVAASIRNADAIVCYSNFVRDRQLLRLLRGPASGKRVEVIPQGFFLEKMESSETSLQDLNALVKPVVGDSGARGQVQFGSFEYVIYPSVDRPHKNTLTLLKAVEHLVREHQVNVKLIMTSHGATDDLKDYIEQRHLEREVVFMPGLPIEKLNYLIERALAVVHPSLAEGGDIFNFSRAASHDCPALLSDIEVAREMFDRHGVAPDAYRNWMFNPVSAKQLAEKILDVRARRSAYVKEQKEALRSLATYSFDDMARRYYEVYCSL